MEEKTAVSALQEFCSKSRQSAPIYEFAIGLQGGYTCKVTAVDKESYGNGRTKREAKHSAADNIWRKLTEEPEVNTKIQNFNRDIMKELHNHCVLHRLPLPIVKVVEENKSSGPPDYVVCCSVGSIMRYAKSDTIKCARQMAASQVLAAMPSSTNGVPSADMEITEAFEDMTLENRNTFNNYKKLTDAGSLDNKSVPLCDRHNYFKRFCPALKEAAFEVIRSDKYATTKDKAMSLMSALKLTPSIETIDSTSEVPLLKVDLNCEFDCLFLGLESSIYAQIIEYFKDMLV